MSNVFSIFTHMFQACVTETKGLCSTQPHPEMLHSKGDTQPVTLWDVQSASWGHHPALPQDADPPCNPQSSRQEAQQNGNIRWLSLFPEAASNFVVSIEIMGPERYLINGMVEKKLKRRTGDRTGEGCMEQIKDWEKEEAGEKHVKAHMTSSTSFLVCGPWGRKGNKYGSFTSFKH